MTLIRWLLPSRRGSSLGRYDAAGVFESQESKDSGGKPKSLNELIEEFYEGDKFRLLITLQWGGYEARDVKIARGMGLRYKTYLCEIINDQRAFKELDNHEWEPCNPINPLETYFSFLNDEAEFTREVCELYAAHWDGRMVFYSKGD